MAKDYPDLNAYITRIDRLLLYVGRYGRQNVIDLQTAITMRDLIRWAEIINGFLQDENKSIER